jgi:hypothetical protein
MKLREEKRREEGRRTRHDAMKAIARSTSMEDQSLSIAQIQKAQ